ncbi:hypothetical protein PISMIDRAFT_683891 [Pisolithus microcarpus 441]|uniref:Uncharacterized protein n=1 Tax=Pisolithus microcarpus 441 TaxID=765257 RepID=A0A0C9YQC4_9AGAM|nr:hypothetical protein BKA83DRAFT_683891 [Pisolithus microcarpus]KIK18836.1 hypothetical protein PISMIDRAFT_683891 [Pisolithus microcarpus 441]
MVHVVGSARVQNRTDDAGTYLGAYSNCHSPHAFGQHTFASAAASYGSKGLRPPPHGALGSTPDWRIIRSETLPRKKGGSEVGFSFTSWFSFGSDHIPDVYHQQHRKSLGGAAELHGVPGSSGDTLGPMFHPRRPALQNVTVNLSSCTHFWCIYMFYTIFLVLSRLRT